MIRTILILLTLSCFGYSPLLAQVDVSPDTPAASEEAAAATDEEEAFADEEGEEEDGFLSDLEGDLEEEFKGGKKKKKKVVLGYESHYVEIDLGVDITFIPHESFFDNYKDADFHPSLHAALSYTYDRYRLELGYMLRSYKEGEPDVTSYKGNDVKESSSELDIIQKEYSLFWLRNDPHRVSYIGLGYVELEATEKLKLTYTQGGKTVTETLEKKSKGNGFKFTVGGKDVGSYLKVYASYTSAQIDSIAYQRTLHIGGYAMAWQLSFGGP